MGQTVIDLLSSRTSLADCVWVDEDRIDLIAETGSVAVHNQVSNLGASRSDSGDVMLKAGASVTIRTVGHSIKQWTGYARKHQVFSPSARCAIPRC